MDGPFSWGGAHWFVSLLVDDGIAAPAEHAAPGTAVGVDRGVVVATSDGELADREFVTTGERRRLVALQRAFGVVRDQVEAVVVIRAFVDPRRDRRQGDRLGVIAVRHRDGPYTGPRIG